MERKIIHDPVFLSRKSVDATIDDREDAMDLVDTLFANRESCVGIAANMIGVRKRIIAFNDNEKYTIMYNPEIVDCSGEYETEEGCLSLNGLRKAKRYKLITVKYQDLEMEEKIKIFSGWTAQIIQHEIDHCNGILI